MKPLFKTYLSLLLAVPTLLTLSGCASLNLDRSEQSGYADAHEPSSHDERRRERLDSAAQDLGFGSSGGLSDDDETSVRDHALLARGERFLEGKREREQYFKNKSYMKNDAERIAFLRLPDFEARESWLLEHHINENQTVHGPEVQSIIDQSDVAIGMTKQAVRDSWGPPEAVEVAGNPLYGNERWIYSEEIASTEGYRNEKRRIIFESGRVVGWERR